MRDLVFDVDHDGATLTVNLRALKARILDDGSIAIPLTFGQLEDLRDDAENAMCDVGYYDPFECNETADREATR